MTAQLYLVPLDKAQTTDPPTQSASANVSSSGFIGKEGGLSTEKIALGNVDLSITGTFGYAEFSKKLKREVESLGESSFENVPFADVAANVEDGQSGYYEVGNVDVNPAHQSTDLAFQYAIGLNYNGTRASHWRAVETNSETINTGLTTGSGGQIGIPTEASNVRWYSSANSPADATVQSTVNAEYGDVDLYDPTEPSFDDPTLIYSLSFDREGPVDVRVWDDIGESNKFASYTDGSGTTHTITQWVHAYHSDFEFEGEAIIDNGLLRTRYDEANGVLEAWQWDDANSTWSSVSISMGDYELYDADVQRIGPSRVDVYAEYRDTVGGGIDAAIASMQRGISGVVLRQPPNGSVASAVESIYDPIASNQTTDKQPETAVVARSDVK